MCATGRLATVALMLSLTLSGGLCWQKEGQRWAARAAKDRWSLYWPSHVQEGSSCHQALTTMSHSFNQTWVATMIDSWGKNADGLMLGNTQLVGMFDECVHSHSPDHSIRGKYCSVVLGRKSGVKDSTIVKQEMFGSGGAAWPGARLAPASVQSGLGGLGGMVSYATCIPDDCTLKDFQESLSEDLNQTNFQIQLIDCQLADSHGRFTTGDIIFTAVVSCLLALTLVAGAIDLYIQKTSNRALAKGWARYILPFSIYTNSKKLFQLNPTRDPRTISCLHGIRVLSMAWVVYGHQQMATLGLQANLLDIAPKTSGLLFQAVANANVSVDTFFFMSGLLLSSSVLRQLSKTGKLNLVIYYLHRLIRLVPPMAFVAAFVATVSHFFVSGPLVLLWEYFQNGCKHFWWRDILFVNNFVNDPRSDAPGDCLSVTWYLAVDTQLYLVAPLILLPLYFFRGAGKAWLYVLTLASVITPAAVIYAYDLPPNSMISSDSEDYKAKVYFTPWCHASPWLAGIWLGYAFFSEDRKKVVLQRWQVVAGWTVAATTGFLDVFGIWSYNTVPARAQYDIMTQVVYGGMHTMVWGLALAWVVYACQHGCGGLVDDFLSHPVWQPASRLTYTTYLVAMSMQQIITSNARTPLYFTHVNKVIESVGSLVVSAAVAVPVTLIAESPIIGLEKILLRKV